MNALSPEEVANAALSTAFELQLDKAKRLVNESLLLGVRRFERAVLMEALGGQELLLQPLLDAFRDAGSGWKIQETGGSAWYSDRPDTPIVFLFSS